MSEQFSVTGLNRIKRVPKRADYDKEGVYAVVDAALICHVGMVTDEGQPVVIPTIHARQGDNILIHGATTSRMLNYIGAGKPICITFT
ncbi:MAG: pyridoxamine 5'-phosphate oxidase family protein, partial [Anaerolineales bacterium]|nr:pyridoxamine 5'-phosphate oxidase family protein [Anaerolineales bacterium]